MSSYFVKFIAHLDRLRRPDSWSEYVELIDTFSDIESLKHLEFKVNERFVQLVSSAGLVIPKDHHAIEDRTRVTYATRIFIPWHMVTYFEMDEPKLISEFIASIPQDALIPEPEKEEIPTPPEIKQ